MFDSTAPPMHNGRMNANDETPNSGEHLESEKKPDQTLSRSEKIISAGLIAAAAVLWGVYGPGLMRLMGADEFLQSNKVIALLFVICIVVSCIVLLARAARERERKPRRWWASNLCAAAPWLITLPLLLTVNFQWKALISSAWAFMALLTALWDLFAKTEPKCHPAKEDLLGRGLMYSRFGDKIRILVGKNGNEEKGLSVLVTGEWGSGKSHFINATVSSLEHEYQEHRQLYCEPLKCGVYRGKFVAINLDLWQYNNVDVMWKDVAHALFCILKGYDPNTDNVLRKILNALLSLLPFNITNDVKEISKLVSTGGDNYVFSDRLINHFKQSPLRYILVLDNMERCNSLIRDNVFSLIERLNMIPHLVVICGFANGVMHTVTSKEASDFQSAMLKIFDIQFMMPLLMREQAGDYLHRLLCEVAFDCPNFKSWCQKCNFEHTTPRLLEKLVSKLSLFDNLYISRNENAPAYSDVDWGEDSVVNLIFDFETLRLLFPEIDYPHKDGNARAQDEDAGEMYKEWRESFKKKIIENAVFNKTGGLLEMAVRVSLASDRALNFIANQNYLRISSLTDSESERLLDSYREGSNPIVALREAYGDAYNSRVENDLVRGMCKFCIGHPNHHASLPFVKALCETEHALNLLPHYTVTNLIVVVQSEWAESSRWEDCLQSIIRIYPVDWLAEEVGKIVDYIGKDKERIEIRYELSSRLTKAAKDILDGYGRDGEHSGRLSKVADKLLREYAKKACAFILDSPSLNDYGRYKHLMIGRSVPQNIYDEKLKEGVQEFLNSDASIKYRQKVGEYMRRLLRSIIIRSHDSETLELTDMPFAVLSFAVIWSNLCLGLIKQGELMKNLRPIVWKRLAAIKTRVEKDAKMSKEEKQSKGSEQFWRNRETAMRILITTLLRLKKQANE